MECTGSHRASDLEHSRWLVAIGKEVMEVEIERGRDDERHCLRRQSGYLKNQVQQAGDCERDNDAANAGDVEAPTSLEP
jgi:hypothetical protein